MALPRRVFRTRTFARWMRKTGVSDGELCVAIAEMEQGLIDARLGGRLIKKRVALAGRGKRAGARTLVATNLENRWFFLYGFAKRERANIDQSELRALQQEAKQWLALDDRRIAVALFAGEIVEICNGDQAPQESESNSEGSARDHARSARDRLN